MPTVKEAIYKTVHHAANGKPLKQLAEEIGVSENYLGRAALPDQEDSETGTGCRFPLKKVVPLVHASQDYAIPDAIEEAIGRVAFELPTIIGKPEDVIKHTMRSIKEFGELMSAIDKGLARDGLNEKEKDRITKEAHDVIREVATLLKAIGR